MTGPVSADSSSRVATPTATVVAVQEDIIRLRLNDPDEGRLVKNEVIYIRPARAPDQRLKGEVLRVQGDTADAQVFESTVGVGLGDPVEQTGRQLSIRLGPGLLGQVYDGLQNPLEGLAAGHGVFLPRGVEVPGLDRVAKWAFTATRRVGDRVKAGDVLGLVPEGPITHKIMVPFGLDETVTIDWIRDGSMTIDEPLARLKADSGASRTITMEQEWPVREALPRRLLAKGYSTRLYPHEPMVTTQRIIDAFFPVVQGGAACIPGPFGAGKTVLLNLLARHSDVDVVILVACGERAGEVVETITEFPQLTDPRTGNSLMDRTVIVCNTSSMPVASREASIYTGITIGEYYRQMGLRTLMIADSSSRWAQAMREISGRLEEIPGEEAFPAYLDSAIKGVYERAGVLATNDGDKGALTIIGAVSPAGGNFEEPVTQSTLAAVKCFLGLSYDRAYKRFYPAIDPLQSWSRYRQQLEGWYTEHMGAGWSGQVTELIELLRRGDEIARMEQVAGEEGISTDDFVTAEAARFVDMVFLQQDAFDPIDSSASPERQKELFSLVYSVATRPYGFEDKDAVRRHFTKLTGLFKNYNYAAPGSNEATRLLDEIAKLDAAAPVS
ncbi:V/A-type H+-transporting ATPase subunit A [Pseudochelatococcus lubricantis]|uniref:V-type ATP synthase alpha chain n=1 Tax=Pseudochelatococcus lubricantis TaxID=1538102 RepID=A0ABX0UZH5_9HYPH|nr:V-type ATP synthase subunit A [Pseudochelatococcus lubricantis]NIJ58354.1 V/A-type H+-transporting ATPase subunit A [Pseudochelatococcus lubricantis]